MDHFNLIDFTLGSGFLLSGIAYRWRFSPKQPGGAWLKTA